MTMDSAVKSLNIIVIDDDATGISEIDSENGINGNVYNKSGQLVKANAKNLKGLAPGTYIVNGMKVVVRH